MIYIKQTFNPTVNFVKFVFVTVLFITGPHGPLDEVIHFIIYFDVYRRIRQIFIFR
jgi:hypothetical protein